MTSLTFSSSLTPSLRFTLCLSLCVCLFLGVCLSLPAFISPSVSLSLPSSRRLLSLPFYLPLSFPIFLPSSTFPCFSISFSVFLCSSLPLILSYIPIPHIVPPYSFRPSPLFLPTTQQILLHVGGFYEDEELRSHEAGPSS